MRESLSYCMLSTVTSYWGQELHTCRYGTVASNISHRNVKQPRLGRQADRQTGRQTDRQADRQTDRQTDASTKMTDPSSSVPLCARCKSSPGSVTGRNDPLCRCRPQPSLVPPTFCTLLTLLLLQYMLPLLCPLQAHQADGPFSGPQYLQQCLPPTPPPPVLIRCELLDLTAHPQGANVLPAGKSRKNWI